VEPDVTFPGRRPTSRIETHGGYTLLTLAYMGAIYWLSSQPPAGAAAPAEAATLWNKVARDLLHIPLYAGLAFCFLQALSAGPAAVLVPWQLVALTLLGTAGYAAFDEWHQSWVPGRHGSFKDFVLDLAGIGTMLLLVRTRLSRGVHGGDRHAR
jgi:VanZ family protein